MSSSEAFPVMQVTIGGVYLSLIVLRLITKVLTLMFGLILAGDHA
jgi:hypothetical protein